MGLFDKNNSQKLTNNVKSVKKVVVLVTLK